MADERHERGKAAEDAAARALKMLGFDIEGRNVRVGRLEADIVARDDDGVAVVEVRARQEDGLVDPFESIDAGKSDRVRQLVAELARGRDGRAVYVGVTLRADRPASVRVLDVT